MMDRDIPSLISWRIYNQKNFFFLTGNNHHEREIRPEGAEWDNPTYREKLENPQKCFHENIS